MPIFPSWNDDFPQVKIKTSIFSCNLQSSHNVALNRTKHAVFILRFSKSLYESTSLSLLLRVLCTVCWVCTVVSAWRVRETGTVSERCGLLWCAAACHLPWLWKSPQLVDFWITSLKGSLGITTPSGSISQWAIFLSKDEKLASSGISLIAYCSPLSTFCSRCQMNVY